MKPPSEFTLLPLLIIVSILRMITASGCSSTLGMESGDIADRQLTASSFWRNVQDWHPREARLRNSKAWYPNIYAKNEWLQVDLLKRTSITGIQTQGHWRVVSFYASSFKLRYSDNGRDWITFQERGSDKVFDGNNDSRRVKTNRINPAIRARFIRVMAETWTWWGFAFRVELLGCELESTTAQTTAAATTSSTTIETTTFTTVMKETTQSTPSNSFPLTSTERTIATTQGVMLTSADVPQRSTFLVNLSSSSNTQTTAATTTAVTTVSSENMTTTLPITTFMTAKKQTVQSSPLNSYSVSFPKETTVITKGIAPAIPQRSTSPVSTVSWLPSPFANKTSGNNDEQLAGNQAGSTPGATIGGAVAAGVVIITIAIMISIFFVRRRRSKATEENESSPQADETGTVDNIYYGGVRFAANGNASTNGNVSIGQSEGMVDSHLYAAIANDISSIVQSEGTVDNTIYAGNTNGNDTIDQSEGTVDNHLYAGTSSACVGTGHHRGEYGNQDGVYYSVVHTSDEGSVENGIYCSS